MSDGIPLSETAPDGIVIIDKPQGLTSQAVVSRVRRALNVRKAGHAGTLDPMATGVLLVGVGRATRLLGYLAGHDKRYLATIRLGQATTTDDAEGEPLGEPTSAVAISDSAISEAITRFKGDIEQVPSTVSAIKVAGKRAYALARAGESVALASRTVTVTRFDLLARRDCAPYVDLDVDVECGSGTYIRALARDLGAMLHVGGHLSALRRMRVGKFAVAQASALDAVSAADIVAMGQVAEQVFPWVAVSQTDAAEVRFGRPLNLVVAADPTAILDADHSLLALYRPDSRPGWSRPVAVFV
ncbi:MAG: tRNA pseudouridine(55) synthase TruB [Propionibacteriaceae bacterium]|nr:tRNA pseudouridine(55) synthase TruB [Propionibacteriaceae bacterium]